MGLQPSFKEKRLENAYFDTPDFRLHAAKVALRIRKQLSEVNQQQFIQTLKAAGVSRNGLSERGGWEWRPKVSDLDLTALAGCAAWPQDIGLDQLQKIFETNFPRCACEISWKESLVELV